MCETIYYYCDNKNVISQNPMQKEVMLSVYELDVYRTEKGREPFTDFLDKLQKENRSTEAARIWAFINRLKIHGMQINSYYPHSIRKVSDKGVWELRPGSNRVFFFHFTGEKFVLLHAYHKHSQKAPPSEIRQAEDEMKDYQRRS